MRQGQSQKIQALNLPSVLVLLSLLKKKYHQLKGPINSSVKSHRDGGAREIMDFIRLEIQELTDESKVKALLDEDSTTIEENDLSI